MDVEVKAPDANLAGLAHGSAIELGPGVGMVDEDVADIGRARNLELLRLTDLTVDEAEGCDGSSFACLTTCQVDLAGHVVG